MSTTTPSEPCQACLTIDRADGVEDGNLYKVEHYSTRNERSLLRSLQRTQDRVADALTALAKSFDYDQILVLLQSVGVVERECVDDLLVNASTCASVISHENAFFNSVASDFRVN